MAMTQPRYKTRKKYDNYLEQHLAGVKKAYKWLGTYLPDVLEDLSVSERIKLSDNIFWHDSSKRTDAEYEPYAEYFFNTEITKKIEEDFNYAWLHHIHNNPHHWQHWTVAGTSNTVLEMPKIYVIEMICDWWSFGWNKKEPAELFDWYEKNGSRMLLGPQTREYLESILEKISNKITRAK